VVTDLRGPAERATFGGMIPFVVGGATDITVSFQALSYPETLTVTVTAIADPDRFPDLRLLGRYLRDSLAAVAAGRNG
jgi:diacylglycerol O-acyltransferase / wax synthase